MAESIATAMPLADATTSAIAPEVVALWPNGAPEANGEALLDRPVLTVHRADPATATGCAVIVAPGGGYRILASDHEGLQVARWLNRQGITAFVLRYRVGPTYHSRISRFDGLRAVRLVRRHARDFGIAPDRLGLLGFSAGGHLTVAVGTGWDDGDPRAEDPIEQVSSRPDFLVPIYAVTNGLARGRKADEYTPADAAVNDATPPCFLVHTHEDATVPAHQSTLFYDALLRAGVAAELHIFNDGDHGLGLMAGDPDVAEWTQLLLRWLRRRGFLTAAQRTGVRGTVRLNGAPMGMVWITLLPHDHTHPIARVRINRATDGAFEIPVAQGPVPGAYTLEVHHVSEQYPHTADGRYTLNDARCHRRSVQITNNAELTLALTDTDFV